MGIDLKLTVDGLPQFTQALDFVSNAIKDFKRPFSEVEQLFYQIEAKQFASQGARATAWRPLSAAYAKWKARHYPGQPILQLTGALRRALTGRGAGGIRIMTPTDLTLGTNLIYGLPHQRGRGRMPARPPIELTERDERKIVMIFLQAMADAGKDAGFDVPYRDIFDNASEASGAPF